MRSGKKISILINAALVGTLLTAGGTAFAKDEANVVSIASAMNNAVNVVIDGNAQVYPNPL